LARLANAGDATVGLSGDLEGAPWSSTHTLAFGAAADHQAAIVPRLWAAQRIEDLIALHDPKADKESVELSKRFHVLSRLTSMLVLENDAMFAAYGVKRTVASPNAPSPSPATD